MKYFLYILLFFTSISKLYPLEVVSDSLLAEGTHYYFYKISSGGDCHNVHVIEADLAGGHCSPVVIKAKNQNRELCRLHDIITYYDSLYSRKVLAAVNANFWSAYTNYPIGPTVISGEVVEITQYKKWSSIFFDSKGLPYISDFNISAELKFNNKSYNIESVNKRKESNGIVIYNKYGGKKIPYITTGLLSKVKQEAIDEALEDTLHKDVTDQEIDLEKIIEQIVQEHRIETTEYSLNKCKLIYLESPAVNKDIPCIVASIDTGAVDVPSNGMIISFGEDFHYKNYPIPGDTVIFRAQTNRYKDTVFINSVSGTPRIVRNGKANHEAHREGAKSRRFIGSHLPRTAIGYNKDKSKLYLVTVESGWRKNGCKGAALDELAVIMKKLGAYDAMNLDGGGSSIMVINNKNIMKRDPNSSRRISVGIGIIPRIKMLKNIFNK